MWRLSAISGLVLAASVGVSSGADHRASPLESSLLEFLRYTETFSPPVQPLLVDTSTLEADEIWTPQVIDGEFRLENSTIASAVRTYATKDIIIGGRLQPSDGASPSARIKVVGAIAGGAGLLIGDTGGYYLFAIGGDKNFSVLRKVGSRTSRVAVGTNDAIHSNEFNDVTISVNEGAARFIVNGTEIYSISDDKMKRAHVGIAAYGVGHFSFDEFSAVPDLLVLDSLGQHIRSCELPRPGRDDLLTMANLVDGGTISSLSLVGQDETTTSVEVKIPAGNRPVYFVGVSPQPIIWRVTGAVGRISSFVAVSDLRGIDVPASSAGVVGLPSEKVNFRQIANCFEDYAGPTDTLRVAAALGLATGIVPTTMTTEIAAVTAFDAVTGEIDEEGSGVFPPGLPEDMTSATASAGIVSLQLTDVIAQVQPEPYSILPREWGLAQLLVAGALEYEGDRVFKVIGPMRYPAGLTGEHAVTFQIPPGSEEPSGIAGTSKIVLLPPETMSSLLPLN